MVNKLKLTWYIVGSTALPGAGEAEDGAGENDLDIAVGCVSVGLLVPG